MLATNNLTSLGLYIAYSAATQLGSTISDTQSWPQALQIKEAIQHALKGQLTQEEGRRLLNAASAVFFFLYLMSAYAHGAKTKEALTKDMHSIQSEITQLNQKMQELFNMPSTNKSQ